MSGHDWRNWQTCDCGEPGCRSSYPNRKWQSEKDRAENPASPISAALKEEP